KLTATVKPDNTTDKSLSWSSSNTSVVTVNNGTITAVGAGSATITVKCGNASATCTISVQ
ncbi:MAG: Ig-like domain-containing protein, partial [Clostridiales bacterium]|nr:Ig-like domain-containing protein [Clostridiales bacterium]